MQHVTRRRVYRAVFVLLGIVPTILVMFWGAAATRRREAAQLQAAWEARVLAETGLRGKADRITVGRRGDVAFENLVLSDPETGAQIARIRRVHLSPAGERGAVIEVAYPEIRPGQLGRLWEPLYDRLRATRGGGEWTGLLSAHHVTLQQTRQAQTLSQLECEFGTRDVGGYAQIDFLLEGYKMNERARVVVSRDRDPSAPPATIVTVKTGTRPLPCSLLAEVVPAVQCLGERTHFVGSARWRLDAAGWRGEQMAGTLHDVDLATLVTHHFPHHYLHGVSEVAIKRAEFDGGRLVSAEGTLHSKGGRIGRSLLRSAAESLGCRLPLALEGQDRFAFRQLAVAFQVGTAGLTLRGQCGATGALLESEEGPLLMEGPQPIPVVSLLRMLVPDNAHQVPATRQTDWLAGVLPLPSIVPTARTAARRPDAPPLRLRNQQPFVRQ